ncbi:MAG: diaminopimelate epimerase [Rhodospirillales bacterium]
MPFKKMHGLGNDFVVIDARVRDVAFSDDQARRIADRHTGVGCDQFIVLEPPKNGGADVFMRIRNHDGGEVGACGNATRCIADQLMNEMGTDRAVIETLAGNLKTWRADGGLVTVDMGPVNTDWQSIPLAREMDTLSVDLSAGPLSNPACVNVGNPHASFFVDDVDAIDLATLGPKVEHDPLFPERTNVQAVQILSDSKIRVRVWERGAGITLASGSSACATGVNAHRRGLTGPRVEVELLGGTLIVEHTSEGSVTQTGPFATSFEGIITPDLMGAA